MNLPEPAQVRLLLFNLTGERIYQALAWGNIGENILNWKVCNQANEAVASGVYIYVVRFGDGNEVRTFKGKVGVLH